jgi:hypothetical protein
MPLSIRDRKILWARSGNLCAFPGCTQALVETAAEAGEHVVVGEEAHVQARSRDGPRGGPLEAGTDEYSNVILFCPTHHRIVDAQSSHYTVEMLRAFKTAHEARVRAELQSRVQVDEGLAAAYEAACGGLRIVNAWRYESAAVVVCSFGSDPVVGAGGRWRGAGLEFRHVHDSQGAELLFASSEADPDVEYWVSAPALHVVQATYEPEVGRIVPFAERRFMLGEVPAPRSTHVLLQIPSSARQGLTPVVQMLRALPRNAAAEAEVLLYRLRNAGLSDPDAALAQLTSLRTEWWYDGANAEAAAAITAELALVKEARGGLTRG